MGFFKKSHIALLFDDRGELLAKKSFRRKDDFFTYDGERKFNIILQNTTAFEKFGILWNTKYYFYNINNPNPLVLNKKLEPILNSKIYNVMLETKVARDLNDLTKSTLSQLMTPKNIIIVLAILGAVYYFSSGGTLTGTSTP